MGQEKNWLLLRSEVTEEGGRNAQVGVLREKKRGNISLAVVSGELEFLQD